MSTVVWLKNIRIEVRSKEAKHQGRPHCHAVFGDFAVSIDLLSFEVLESTGFTKKDVARILEKVKEYQEQLLAKWREYHG